MKNQPKDVRNNEFIGYLGYFNQEEQTETLDLRYNYWGRDWYVEDVVGLDEWEDEIDIDFEPYFDGNGTLTDDDGIPNGWEINNELDIYEDDSGEDPDEDGLTNIEEHSLGGDFLHNGTDPNDEDTDDDLLPDGWEVENGLDPLFYDSGNDTDDDGWTNLEEYNESTDINDLDSHPEIPDDGDNSESNYWYIIGGIVFVLIDLILLVAILIYIGRRKDQDLAGNREQTFEAVEIEDDN